MKKENTPIYWIGSIIVVALVVFLLVINSGNILNFTVGREKGELVKMGTVTKIEYDVIFGGTFTDWRHDMFFEDGTILWVETRNDLSRVKIGISARYVFEKNYFTYDGIKYEFHDLKAVQYLD